MIHARNNIPKYLLISIALAFPSILFVAGCNDSVIMGKTVFQRKISEVPLQDEEMTWLKGGEQSRITSKIQREAMEIKGMSRRERLYHAKEYIRKTFSYDNWYNATAFQKTADELFQSRVLGGCSDFALVELVFYRALDIPTRMVVTANVDWLLEYRRSPMSMAEGHCFIEVYLEDCWHLVDPTFSWLFSEYCPDSPCYPHGEYFCRRGRDFWEMGIASIHDFNLALRELAGKYSGQYIIPAYSKAPLY